MKDVFDVWETPKLLQLIEEKSGVLMHENDGLIFTVDKCPYYPDVAPDIVKWKPPHMNTIDFQILPITGLTEKLGIWGLFVGQIQQSVLFDFFMFDEHSAKDFSEWTIDYLKIPKDKLPQNQTAELIAGFCFMQLQAQDAQKAKAVIVECNHRNDRELPLNLIRLKKLWNQTRDELINQKMSDPRGNARNSDDIDVNVKQSEVAECIRMKLEAPGGNGMDPAKILSIQLTSEDKEDQQQAGHWAPMRIRFDKLWPNGLRTAVSVKTSIDNPIYAEDLVAATSHLKDVFGPSGDDQNNNGKINRTAVNG